MFGMDVLWVYRRLRGLVMCGSGEVLVVYLCLL